MKPQIKSKTINFAAVVGALGVVEVNFHLLQDLLGQWYGVSYIVIAALVYYLRTITTEPVT